MLSIISRVGAAGLALAALVSPIVAASATPVGDWQLSTGESRFEISACGENTLCAKLTWLSDEARSDDSLNALLDDYVMQGATPSGVNTWSGTVNYDGDTYSGKLTMVDADSMRLHGCKGIFCKTMELERI